MPKKLVLRFIQPVVKFGSGRKTIPIPTRYLDKISTGTPFMITIEEVVK